MLEQQVYVELVEACCPAVDRKIWTDLKVVLWTRKIISIATMSIVYEVEFFWGRVAGSTIYTIQRHGTFHITFHCTSIGGNSICIISVKIKCFMNGTSKDDSPKGTGYGIFLAAMSMFGSAGKNWISIFTFCHLIFFSFVILFHYYFFEFYDFIYLVTCLFLFF